jgi:outer membrane protein assembly factor BamB
MDWHFRNRLSTRHSFINVPLQMPLSIQWGIKMPSEIVEPPIYALGALYVACSDGIYKLDMESGKVIWEKRTQPSEALKHSPAYYNGRVYYHASFGAGLYCLDAQSGQLIWNNPKVGPQGSALCFSKERIYTQIVTHSKDTSTGKYTFTNGYAGLGMDGEIEWFHQCEGPLSISACSVENNSLIYGDDHGFIYAVDVRTGKELWRTNISYLRATKEVDPYENPTKIIPHIVGVPVIIGNQVVIQILDSEYACALNVSTGKVQWRSNGREDLKGPMASGEGFDQEYRYFYKSGHHITQRIDNGTEVRDVDNTHYWAKKKPGFSRAWEGLVVGIYHFIGMTTPNQIVAFNTNTGSIEWAFDTEGPNFIPGIVADGHIIWGTLAGDLYCFS